MENTTLNLEDNELLVSNIVSNFLKQWANIESSYLVGGFKPFEQNI